jgi:hypothetical protein
MRSLVLFSVALVLSLVSCKSHKPVSLDPNDDADKIPEAAVLQKLREMLPTADYVYCTAPKSSLKQSEILNWTIESDAIVIDHGRGNTLRLAFGDITDVRLDASGKYFYVKVFTKVQTEGGKPHFEFLFRIEDRAKQVGELLSAQKKRKQ